jgi:membrane associated rhomboid family serine protease
MERFPILTLFVFLLNYYFSFVDKNPIFFFFYHLSLLHFLGNMIVFLFAGILTEVRYGYKTFLLVFSSSLLSSILFENLITGQTPPFYGFSCVSYAFLGFVLMKAISNLIFSDNQKLAFFLYVLEILLITLNFLQFFEEPYRIAVFGHAMGFLTGFLSALKLS